jgi:hypothetical protein
MRRCRTGAASANPSVFHFFQHPSSVSTLRADPPSPTRGEGAALHRACQRLEPFAASAETARMAKPPKRPRAKRSPSRNQFLGRTEDGLLIPRPDFMPVSFTLRELDRAIRAAKRRQAADQVG